MEYKDYKTGKGISREQYIKNGLERGELMVQENCGCVVIQDRTVDAYIVYCSKHSSAPDLYEALMEFPHYLTASNMDAEQILDRIREWRNQYWQPALAKADGK